jgi:hypothetical protein
MAEKPLEKRGSRGFSSSQVRCRGEAGSPSTCSGPVRMPLHTLIFEKKRKVQAVHRESKELKDIKTGSRRSCTSEYS